VGGGGGGGAGSIASGVPGGDGGRGYYVNGLPVDDIGGAGGGGGGGTFIGDTAVGGNGGLCGGGGGGSSPSGSIAPPNGGLGVIMFYWSFDSPPCFNQGTRILCDNDQYRAIEDLRPGMLVKTYRHGYRPIEYIGHKTMVNDPTLWSACMYKIPQSDGMCDDLIMTGGHALLLERPTQSAIEKAKIIEYWGKDVCQIDNRHTMPLAASQRAVQLTDTNTYTYYHLVLEDDGDAMRKYGVWANGVLVESSTREQFLAHRYTLL
jgi:hypothetical protein